MGASSHGAVALDAGALIALESPRGRALLREIATGEQVVVLSAGALAQARRNGARQVLLGALLRRERTIVAPLDIAAAKVCGRLLAHTGSSDAIDAHVVLSAREHGAKVIVTSDPDDLRALDHQIRLHRI